MAAKEIPNWSSTLEELLDDGKHQEAQQLLEGLVAQLQGRPDAPSNLTLAAALSDLASVYRALGLSSQALSASSAALHIKETVQCLPPSSPVVTECDHRPRETYNISRSADLEQTSQQTEEEEASQLQHTSQQTEEAASKLGPDGEEEWETLLCDGLVKLDGLSPAKIAPDVSPVEKVVYKQRGRGAFTRGEMGMHIDRLTSCASKGKDQLDRNSEEEEEEDTFISSHTKVACGVRHVLVVSFPPSVTTKDLEELFEPFGSPAVVIRWVNDTTALAVFRNPEVAKEALRKTKNPNFKLERLTEDSSFTGVFNEQDLQPPVARPPTSSQAAHRMIMGALQRQGIHKKPSAPTSFADSQKQEMERKQRLLTRQRLREEAWGSES